MNSRNLQMWLLYQLQYLHIIQFINYKNTAENIVGITAKTLALARFGDKVTHILNNYAFE